MIIKVSYKKETHVMVLDQADYASLVQKVKTSFLNAPASFNLSYIDCEGDRISVANSNDLDVIFAIPNQKSIKLEIQEGEEHQEDEQRSFEIDQMNYTYNQIEQEENTFENKVEEELESQEQKPETITEDSKTELKKETSLNVEDEIAELIRSRIQTLIPEIKSKIQQSKPLKASHIHHGVRCDGCGVKPIVGNRYKCSICHDFDYCEKCQDTIDHPHAFLKIKRPDQAPRILITSMLDDFIPGLDINGITFDQANLETLFNKFQPETKVQVPVEQEKIEQTVETKVEEEKKQISQTIKQVEVPSPKQQIKQECEIDDSQQRTLVAASQLQSIYGIEFADAYNFVERNPQVSLEELCQRYYNKVVSKTY